MIQKENQIKNGQTKKANFVADQKNHDQNKIYRNVFNK